jgi:hypothetical protein
MATPKLTHLHPVSASGRLPAHLASTWLRTYAVLWTLTIASGVLVALVGQPLTSLVRGLLGLALSAQRNPPPDLSQVLALAAQNIPLACWPLLLGAIEAHHSRRGIRIADTLLAAVLLVNTAQVGAALAAYGLAVLPYLPQLPLEWGSLALGASSWLLQKRQPLTVTQGLSVFVLTSLVMLGAAVVEIVAVPHR